MPPSTKFSDSLVFPVTPLQKAIADIIPTITIGGRWSAFHAICHLNRAWGIKDIDKEMALFRAITAEEEAATAVFLGLKFRKYKDADKLKARDHVHKNALSDFIIRINNKLVTVTSGSNLDQVSLIVDEDSKLGIEIRLKTEGNEEYPYRTLRPTPPLEFKATEKFGDGVARALDFRSYFSDIVADKGLTLEKYLKERANLRNRLLYAPDNGIPTVQHEFEQSFETYKRNTFFNLSVYLLIVQYSKPQTFVQDALNSFLQVVNAIPPQVEISFRG